MKKLIISALFAAGLVAGVEAAPADAVTQADLQTILERLNKLEAENKAQAKKIAELEGRNRDLVAKQSATEKKVETVAVAQKQDDGAVKADKTTEVSDSGRIFTTESGKKYYLADATAKIFEPLSESGLQITPYGYLVLEGVYSDHGLDLDYTTDFVLPKSDRAHRNRNSTLSVQDSIFGIQFMTPEAVSGWKFSGKMEMDLAGDNADDYAFHWRHLYVNAEHESGWSILFGQTWHLWKMVSPSEIDGAWMENAGHPYRRSPQLRVTKKWDWEDSSLEWRVGFVKNGPNASTDRDDDGMLDSTASAWGWFETALVYDHDAAWDNGRRWLVGFGGMYGRDSSRRLTASGEWDGRSDSYNSQMAMVAASIPFLEKFTLTGQVYGGENLGRVQAGCAQSIAFTPGVLNERGREVTTVGGFVDLAYELNDTWSFALGYGFDDPRIANGMGAAWDGGVVDTNYYEFNDRLYVDAFYRITANFKLGLEYARLTTKYAEDGTSLANRIQFTAFYDF